jgi:hypothetical protein
MEQKYKRHLIMALPYCNRDGKWKPDIHIAHLGNGDRFHIKLTTFSKNYASEKQAEEAGVSFAKQWIDKGKPAPGAPVDVD